MSGQLHRQHKTQVFFFWNVETARCFKLPVECTDPRFLWQKVKVLQPTDSPVSLLSSLGRSTDNFISDSEPKSWQHLGFASENTLTTARQSLAATNLRVSCIYWGQGTRALTRQRMRGRDNLVATLLLLVALFWGVLVVHASGQLQKRRSGLRRDMLWKSKIELPSVTTTEGSDLFWQPIDATTSKIWVGKDYSVTYFITSVGVH